MIGYMLKKRVNPEEASNLIRQSRYLPVVITQLRDITGKGEDLNAFTSLTSVHALYDSDGAIQLPDTVTDLSLRLPSDWNSPVTRDMFPDQLKRFEFGECFKQSLEPGVLPSSLTELRLYWRHPLLPGVLPSGLVKPTLIYSVNYEITAGVLPDTLEWLETNSSISCHLPPSLRHLKLTGISVLDSSFLPTTLTHLSLGLCHLSGPLPSSVVNFKAGMRAAIEGLNTSTPITHLKLHSAGEEYEEDEKDGEEEEKKAVNLDTCQIPTSVTHLELFHCSFAMKRGTVPNSVTHLSVKHCVLVIEPGFIPHSVIDLTLGEDSGVLEAGVIPSSVKTLYFDGNLPLRVGVIPTSVETLIFDGWFEQAPPPGDP